jgi:isoamyl acetate esterase
MLLARYFVIQVYESRFFGGETDVKKVILIGDSIRMGYQQTVRMDLADLAEVSWPEMNSYDSRNLLAKIDEWGIAPQPDLVHINCGLHDLKRDRVRSEFQVAPADYARKVEEVLHRLRDQTRAKIIWATTTPVNERWHSLEKPFDRFEADVQAYNAKVLEICGRLDIVVDDLYGFAMRVGPDRYLSADGVHFNPDGYEVLGAEVARVIRANL